MIGMPGLPAGPSLPALPVAGGRMGGSPSVPLPRLPAKLLLHAMESTATGVIASGGGLSDATNGDNPMGQATVLQFVPPAANTHYFLTIPLAGPTDLRGGSIEMTVKHAANIGNLSAFDIELHSSTTIGTPTGDYSGILGWNDGVTMMKNGSTGSGTTAGRWQTVAFSTAMIAEGGTTRVAGAGADLSQIRWIRLRIRSASSQPIVQFQFGPIRFQANPLTKAKLILCFDDGHISQYDTALPAIRAKGWAGVLFPGAVQAVIDSDATKLTTAQLQQMQAEGWQIASQAWSAENVQNQTEVDALKAWMAARGLTGGGFGSYFSAIGPRSLASWPTFRDNYRGVRSFDSPRGLNPPSVFGESYPWPDYGWVHALAADASGGGASGFRTAHIDQAIANKGVALMVWHADMTGLQEVIDYADTKRAQIDVVTEAALFAAFARP